jgi:[pyruvate, water dikinase]-phosphate phosphotransferase / [pyruvate, water dikinase] kinase
MSKKYFAYFISDGTGITVEALGRSLLSQFEHLDFTTVTLPFIDSIDKAQAIIQQIQQHDSNDITIIFDTIIDRNIRAIIAQSSGYMVDIFAAFISPLENVLGSKSSYSTGKSHAAMQQDSYKNRIEAVNYAVNNDDGMSTNAYKNADIILIGASRSGKTPTCLYLALQFGVKAANYPLVEEDLLQDKLPDCLRPYKEKLFGLIINPESLSSIRHERRKDSKYASLQQCNFEITTLRKIYKRENISSLNTTHFSIEEISTRILSITNIERRPV